jgi:hypothetical protein
MVDQLLLNRGKRQSIHRVIDLGRRIDSFDTHQMLPLHVAEGKKTGVHRPVLYNLSTGGAGLSEQNGTGSAVALATALLRTGEPLILS